MGENVTIAVVAPIHPEDFFDLLWQGVWEATFDLSSFGVEVQDLATERKDAGRQRAILEKLLANPVDAIAIMPVHGSALDDLIDEHIRNGTQVVTFHADAPGSLRAAYVGPDLQRAGALAGEILAKLMRGHGRILSFPGPRDQFHLAGRYEGFREAVARYSGRMEDTARYLDSDAPEAAIAELLEAFGPAAGYYVGNEDLLRVAATMERLGIDSPCIGFTNTEQIRPYLDRGVVSAVIDENRYQLGYFAVQKAYEAVLKRDAQVSAGNLEIPSSVVFAANASGDRDALHNAFELLVRQRTEILLSYKQSLEEANAKLVDLAITDPLTGLFNRRKFEETIQMEVERARRWGPLSLLMIDLNLFKQVNDIHGHQAGDDVLKAVSQVVKACCRTTDTCARLGGDEFALILPHADFGAAGVVRERIQEQIAGVSVPCNGVDLGISLSIGIGTLGGGTGDAPGLIAAADRAMYEEKQKSRLRAVPAEAVPAAARRYK